MTNPWTKKQIALAVSCALTLGLAAGVTAAAETIIDPADTGYLTDARGVVVTSGSGLCWHTGTGPAATTMGCDPTPAIMPAAAAAEPAPKPLTVAAATPAPSPSPKPVAERMSLDADALFDFDKSVLRPAGRTALDEFVGKLADMNPEVITAVGHTDRFGSEGYNQQLSEARVAAVRTYLMGKGIDQNRIHTEGKGETQPLTLAGACDGAKSTQVIACLQPDRRVDIAVVGTRIIR